MLVGWGGMYSLPIFCVMGVDFSAFYGIIGYKSNRRRSMALAMFVLQRSAEADGILAIVFFLVLTLYVSLKIADLLIWVMQKSSR